MKTKLLRKIRKRFEYKFEIKIYHIVHVYDKKTNTNNKYNDITQFIRTVSSDLNLDYLYCYKRKSTIRRNRKYFDSLK